MAIAACIAELLHYTINNYYIFKGVFWHTIAQTNLYTEYPSEYFDVNHYGPFFSFVIAPFAVLPDWLGVLAWCLFNSFVLFYAINRLSLPATNKLAILAIATIEMMTSIHNVQMNPMLAGWLLLAFVLTENGKVFWAALFIAAGFMTKVYGIAGIIFLIFSNDKPKFILSFLFWLAVMFLLPMAFSSSSFIIASYADWADALIQKNSLNIDQSGGSFMQDISLMGFFRRSFGVPSSLNPFIILGGLVMILLPLLRFNHFKSERFKLSYLAIVLISIVIFSTSAESPTYVIAVAGVAIWYVVYPITWWSTLLLFFTLIITSLSGTDLFPAYIRDHFINPYSLKALPCILVWLILIGHVTFGKFASIKNTLKTHEARKHYIARLQ
jgi:hypothetical protein